MRRRNRTLRNLRRFFKGLLFVPLLLGFLLAGALLWGIPGDAVSRFVMERIHLPGEVYFSRLTYEPGRGWVVEDVQVYGPRDRATPLLTVEELRFRPRSPLRFWKRGWQGIWEISGGELNTELGVWADDLQTRQAMSVSGLNGRMRVHRQRITLKELSGGIADLQVRVTGDFPRTEPEEPHRDFNEWVEYWIARVQPFLPNFALGVGLLDEISFHEPAPVVLHLTLDSLSLNIDGAGPFRIRNVDFTSVSAEGSFDRKFWRLDTVDILEREGRRLKGEALIDRETEDFRVEVNNTLRRYALEALWPFPLGPYLEQLDIRLEDRADFQLIVGPAPLSNPAERIEGTFWVENSFYRDAFFSDLRLRLSLVDTRLLLEEVNGILGQGENAGPLRGELTIDFDTQFFELELDGQCYPDRAMSLVPPEVEEHLREWEFQSEAPRFRVRASRENGDAPVRMDVNLSGESLLWRGTRFDRLEARAAMDAEEFRVNLERGERGSENISGDFTFPIDFSACTFSLISSFYLPDLFPLLEYDFSWVEENLKFRGESRIKAEGVISLEDPEQSRMEGEALFTDLVYQWLLFDNLSTTFTLRGETLTFPDIAGVLVDGEMEGVLELDHVFADPRELALELSLTNVDLFEVITKATDTEDTPYSGNLTLDLLLEGPVSLTDENWLAALEGEGSVEIKEGTLFQIPLLLGLSRILSRVVRGFGYASQTDFTADFTLDDGILRSRSLFLRGNLLSIAGRGEYRFESRDIRANLKVQLLSEGVLSEALNLVLWPIRKLIEVQLTGTLDQPDWQPRNLPREIFGR